MNNSEGKTQEPVILLQELAKVVRRANLNLDIQFHNKIAGLRKWVIKVEDPTGFLKDHSYKTCGSLEQSLQQMLEKLPY